jgi:phosphoribosyl 1,2-cyclic phosphate phosphodiesterase
VTALVEEVLFLGSGTSHGVPMIGCDCEVCTSSDPRDRRYRASVALTLTNDRVIVIDVTPEFRLAAVEHRLERLDAILLTHAHADHIMGLDDVRRFNDRMKRQIGCFSSAATIATVRAAFAHADRDYRGDGWPSLGFEAIDAPREIAGATVTPVPLLHGRSEVLGFRIGDFAYCTDCSAIPDASRPLLAGLDLLVLDGLRYTPHPTHFNVASALAEIEKLSPRRALLTHIAHQIGHARTSAELPSGVSLAYDGLHVRPQAL